MLRSQFACVRPRISPDPSANLIGGRSRTGSAADAVVGGKGFVLHQKGPPRAQRQRRDRRVRPQEALVVAAERDAVRAACVVVHEAEVIRLPSRCLRQAAQFVQTCWDRARLASYTCLCDGLTGLCVHKEAVWGEAGGLVDAEDGREAWRVDASLCAAALDGVLDRVGEEIVPEEFGT